MNIAFVGLFINPNDSETIFQKSISAFQTATNTFQWNIIDGLDNNLPRDSTTLFNAIPVGTFPNKYKGLFLETKKWSHNKTSSDFEIGGLNVHFFKQLTRKILFKKALKKWIKSNAGKKHIIAYGLYMPFIKCLKEIKTEYPDVEITFIVADIPYSSEFLSGNSILAAIQSHRSKNILDSLGYVDSFVLLTKQMKEPLQVGKRPFVVVEGMISNSVENDNLEISDLSEKKVILYTGALSNQFGISNLVEAFSDINDEGYELWICGDGDARNTIVEASQNDKRIKYFGFLKPSEISEKRKKATVLINPRQNIGEYTKFSFPSKTMEYIASGKPVIGYKLEGIPEEYDEHLFYVEDNSIEALRKKIVEVCSKQPEELYSFGREASAWILKEKNNVKQTKKIIEMFLGEGK